MEKLKVIAVAGPTASGKSGLAIELAKKLDAEVISCDSMQIYKGMDIGTAKVTADEADGIVHHLIDFVDPAYSFSVSDYVNLAHETILDIKSRNKNVIIAGGTGLYLRSLLYGIEFSDNSSDEKLRDELTKKAETNADELFEQLKILDPVASENIHVNNTKRLVRALEYCLVTGEKISEQSVIKESKYDYYLAILEYNDREKLYQRINYRVDLMIEQGLLEEARDFINNKGTAVQAIGYKELNPYFQGEIDLETATENIKRETRRYAKRQLTWFRKEQNAHRFNVDEYEDKEQLSLKIYNEIIDFLR